MRKCGSSCWGQKVNFMNKSFLEKLQSADEVTKKRWMVLSTVVVMAVVVYIWLAYFNSLVASFSQQQVPSGSQANEGRTFWQTMKNGAAILYQGFMNKLRFLSDILSSPREYIIQPPR